MSNFFFSFQVYKIENSDVDDKAVYIAATSLYQLIQKEQGIVCTALSYDAEVEENKFNDTVNAAVADFNAFSTNKWANPSPMDIQLFTNLSDFFDFIIDVKKAESAAAAAATVAGASSTSTRSAGEPPAKKAKK